MLKKVIRIKHGQLAVYQMETEEYELRESKITNGNQFIKELLGVNAGNLGNYLSYLKVSLKIFIIKKF
ncbi:hypothetical protein J4710_08210 [Staphylococcus xylosus]|uniref:Uncharacterized protein n=1 Tax=Staphylococcus xylosus TaxID=1288 RepID=A0A939NIX6_STAXY|nr:hypothetical protein [Staphylococcus xylosus]